MAVDTWKNLGFKIDSAAGSITDISAYVNSASLQAAITIIESTGIGATARTKQNGLGNITVPINGFVNSTTEAIFGPIINGTSITKTVEFKIRTGRYFTGEVIPSSIQFSGSPDTLQTFSAQLEFNGACTRTSQAAA
jgi:hypothetical protein